MGKATSKHLEEWASPRTVIAFSLLFVAALWAAVSFWVVSARDERIAATRESLQRMNYAVEDQTRRQFRLVNVFLAVCANWLETNRDLDPRSAPGFQRLLDDFRASTAGAIELRLLDQYGTAMDGFSESSVPLANVADSDYFRGAKANGELFIGTPTRRQADAHAELPIAIRLSAPAFPVLVALIDLSKLTAAYEKQRRKPGGVISLLRADGTLLARAPDDPRLLGQPISGRTLADAQRLQPGQSVVFETSGDKQQRQFISYSSVTDFPLLVTVAADYDEALAPWRTQALWVLMLAISVTVPLAVVAFRSLHLLRALANQGVELQHLAITDRLTGVSSRQHFVASFHDHLRNAKRAQAPLSLLLMDIDFFKRINDGYGHAAGDQTLISFAEAASTCLRDADMIGRLGAGEFAMLLPDTDISAAIVVAERIRAAVAEISIPTEDGTVQFTVSVGANQTSDTDQSFDDVLKRAARALHDARASGPDHLAVV
ncbi:MAG: Bacteriophytochrome cph2 [Candidatus Accumulibacter appositus]|uniref:diguanylate cyclase n=1 Tax=Candidatus Accumulibacter appositus TaxID=1454003 RepID=A0A011QP10_9PROT|nr:diguanylate cyclase [Accumulibacter sp.]EXI80604.1 MAG: Bacteriophytochrome cph2 [Candidatus Accumulibacter appositus]HRF05615.1 diguanylate cyclase [Accumulibacter sp.]